MNDDEHKDSVCSDCATRMGYEPSKYMVGMWMGECDFCGRRKPLTSLTKDWHRKENNFGIAALNDKIAAKDSEIARWREQALQEDATSNALRDQVASLTSLVRELADALETKTDAERDCNGICRACRRFINIRECEVSTNTALVAKAREVSNG